MLNAPAAPETLPQLQPVNAPPAAAPLQPRPPATSFILPLKSAEQIDSVPPMAQPARLPPSAPVLQLPDTEPPSVSLRAMELAERDNTPSVDDDDFVADQPPEIPAAGERNSASLAALSFTDTDPAEGTAQTFFGVGTMGAPSGLQRWAPGAEPVPVARDPDIKLAALEGSADGGETVAKKDDSSLLASPADRLQLDGKPRAKAEKCLADAVYFESRGEPLRGQQAVAQVVMNRVFSGFYPNDVCGVVYQNAHRHLACQFTFACDGKPDKVDEPDMWEQAKRIANDMLDGKIWLAEVGQATHYHAYWVHPSWVHEMTKMYKLGVHTFYRPKNWGDGDTDPAYGPVPNTSKADTPERNGPEAGGRAAKERADRSSRLIITPSFISRLNGDWRCLCNSAAVYFAIATASAALERQPTANQSDQKAVGAIYAIGAPAPTVSHLDVEADVEVLHRMRERAGR